MSLALRLAVVVLCVAVPLGIGAAWARGALERRADAGQLHEFIAARMVDGRAACEANPEHFPPPPGAGPGPRPGGGPGPGSGRGPRGRPGPAERPERPAAEGRSNPVLFAYDAQFRSANPRAPRFPDRLRAELEGGVDRIHAVLAEPGERRLVAGQRMAWDEGPAVFVTASRPLPPRGLWSPAQAGTGAALACALALAVFIAAGPLVRRVRRLTAAVQGAAEVGYAIEVPVSGGDELAELAGAFNSAGHRIRAQVGELEARSRSLREFVANTTHDVMTPMTVLKGNLDMLRRAGDAKEREVLVASAIEEAQYMTSLLQNLAAMARLESEELPLVCAPLDLGALVERVAQRHRPFADSRGIELEYAVPEDLLEVPADRTLLEQAVGNIVHNAIRYGRAGGHVVVLLDARGSGGFALRVIDDGPGIEPEQLARVVERSFRTESARTRAPEGQGLGLHIVQEVVGRHGWRIEFGASEYGGLEVRIEG